MVDKPSGLTWARDGLETARYIQAKRSDLPLESVSAELQLKPQRVGKCISMHALP